ncbi:hypothetical protein ACOMHN_028946 [Nucella lapillus]
MLTRALQIFVKRMESDLLRKLDKWSPWSLPCLRPKAKRVVNRYPAGPDSLPPRPPLLPPPSPPLPPPLLPPPPPLLPPHHPLSLATLFEIASSPSILPAFCQSKTERIVPDPQRIVPDPQRIVPDPQRIVPDPQFKLGTG